MLDTEQQEQEKKTDDLKQQRKEKIYKQKIMLE